MLWIWLIISPLGFFRIFFPKKREALLLLIVHVTILSNNLLDTNWDYIAPNSRTVWSQRQLCELMCRVISISFDYFHCTKITCFKFYFSLPFIFLLSIFLYFYTWIIFSLIYSNLFFIFLFSICLAFFYIFFVPFNFAFSFFLLLLET